MPSKKKRVQGIDKNLQQRALEVRFNLTPPSMVEREVFTSSAFIRAVNQKLKPQYKIGPSNPSTDHPLDSHSLAFRAYKRARGLGKHLATLIENEHMKCSFVRGAFLEDDRLLLNQLAEGKVHPNSEELLKEALRENVHVVEDVGAVAAWLSTKFNLVEMQLACVQNITKYRMEQVRIFLDDKLFVLENEKRQKAKVRYAAYESQICAHDPRAGKDSCNCNGCRKELKILKDVIERASAQGQYEGVPLHSRSKKAPLKAALSEHTQLLEAIVKDVHTLSLSIKNLPSEADKLPKRVTFRELPKHLTFMALPVPSEWPRHIKKAVSDYEYVLFQIDTERDTLINQRGEVRRLLLIGMGDVNSIWHERDELITDCPEVQRYEYTRNSVLTMFVVGGNLETTIHRYVRKEGVKLSGALSEALGLQRPCIPKWRKASWEETFAAMKQEANSIDDMLRQCEKARQNLPSEEAEEATAKYGDWWKVLVDKGTSKKLRAPTANMIA